MVLASSLASDVQHTALKAIASIPEAAQSAPVSQSVEAMNDWLAGLSSIVSAIGDCVWGVPLIGFVLLTGIVLTCMLRLIHVFNLKNAFHIMFQGEGDDVHGEVSQFGALCTALSATIGTGNIVGVATAIGMGGPGALFWMEVAAFFGMATKYAEGLLAVKYRQVAPDGSILGGPFYYIERGMAGFLGVRSWKWLAVVFAVFGTLAGIMGIGTITQVHGITSAVQRFFDPGFNPADMATGIELFGTTYSLPVMIAGAAITVCVGLVVVGGIKRIAAVAMVVVPFMAIFYVIIIAFLLLGNISKVPAAIELVIRAAFNPSAFTAGAVGSVFIAIQKGVARGIFSNEAGLGSAPIAAAAAKTGEPVRQGLVCMTGTFVDTIVVCTMTGLAIVVTGAWEPSLGLKGVDVTTEAFQRGLAFVGPGSELFASFFLMAALTFFAFTTILGWNYYSEKCLEYLIGPGRRSAIGVFRLVYVLVVFVGPYLTVEVVWSAADVFNGLMAFPNLIALVVLSPVVARTTREYFSRQRRISQ